jgi:hypothetical protein
VERVRIEDLGGRCLLVTDLSGLGGDEAPTVLSQTHRELARLPKERSVLSLLIVKDVGMDRVIARGVAMMTGRSFKGFGSEGEARAWLVESGANAA